MPGNSCHIRLCAVETQRWQVRGQCSRGTGGRATLDERRHTQCGLASCRTPGCLGICIILCCERFVVMGMTKVVEMGAHGDG